MFNITKLITRQIIALLATVALMSFAVQVTCAQSSGLRDPLIPGAVATPPFIPAPHGMRPPIGQGHTPAPELPGMGGPSTLVPWVPAVPANDIDLKNTGLSIPFGPPIATPPGVLGPLLTPLLPGPPSTPGAAPGDLQVPPYSNSFNPAALVPVNPAGGLPGTGGFATTIPTIRRGGQQTHQWELRGRNASLIPGLGDGSQSEVTELGPYAGFGVPFGVPTGDGLRNSSVDLGGGERFKIGGVKLSTGSSVQDYGLNPQRNSSIVGISNNRSTEFGQGLRREPIYSSNTTDFGFPYRQFVPANENVQKKAQLLPPTAVETNF
jgi:hypothetical protein